MKLYKLQTPPNASFRVGRADWNDTDYMIHSDTLCSAVIANCAKLYGAEKVKAMQGAYQKGAIVHSSLFFQFEFENENTKETIRFFPKPIGILPPLKVDENGKHNENKEAKVLEAKWVSESLFTVISNQFNSFSGEWKPESALEPSEFDFDLKKDTVVWDNTFIFKKEDLKFLNIPDLTNIPACMSYSANSKNQIDRETMQVAKDEDDKGMLFQEINMELNAVQFQGWTITPRMFFIADVKEMEQEFVASLRLLCDEGIGGERSFGKGRFLGFETADWNGFEMTNGENRICLSLVNPESEDEIGNIQFYDSLIRGGWTGNHKRKSVRMIAEGSYFKNLIKGRMVEVLNDSYCVYQNGKAFFG